MADVAGVSHQAVSRVLNDHPDVSAEARTQVLRAIDQLGCRRNLVARASGHQEPPADWLEVEDQMAPGAPGAFVEQAVRVPGKINIVGFDDIPE
ncbi:hypothetical protein DKM19_20780 [Streptosporangium sp. 'caverna']|nr:hypothetical protein DKM19_20780 [Streptosporangium sp. 'caverna']